MTNGRTYNIKIYRSASQTIIVDTTPEVVRVLPLVHAAVHRGEEVAGVLGVAVRPLVHVHLHGAVNVVTLAYLDTVCGKDMKFPKQEV